MTSKIQQILDGKTSQEQGLVGCVFQAIKRDGSSICHAASGLRQAGKDEKITEDTVFWLASLTKCVTSIAALQLIEQGKVALNQEVAELLPELKNLNIVNEEGEVTSQSKTPITLKMLLTHTAGLSYTFIHAGVKKHVDSVGAIDEFSGKREAFQQPLVCEPGTKWTYSIALDWVGILIERVSGLDLEQYFQQNIFKPLGISDLTFEIWKRPDMQKRLAGMNKRSPDGRLSAVGRLALAYIVTGESKAEFTTKEHLPFQQGGVHSGGGGLLGTATEYLKVLAVWLNDGVGLNGTRILQANSVDLAFKNHIPETAHTMDEDFGLNHPAPALSGPSPGGLPKWSPEDKRGWGIGFCYTETKLSTGRGEGSAWWAGLPNLYWWADRKNGVAGVFCNQILPMGDLPVFLTWMEIEAELYKGLDS